MKYFYIIICLIIILVISSANGDMRRRPIVNANEENGKAKPSLAQRNPRLDARRRPPEDMRRNIRPGMINNGDGSSDDLTNELRRKRAEEQRRNIRPGKPLHERPLRPTSSHDRRNLNPHSDGIEGGQGPKRRRSMHGKSPL